MASSGHTWDQFFRVEHMVTQTRMIRPFCQEARSTEQVNHTLSSHTFVSCQNCSYLCQQHVNALCPTCLRAGAGCHQTIALVVSCDAAEHVSLATNHAAESQNVGCRFEYCWCCAGGQSECQIFFFRISRLQCGQKLVDPAVRTAPCPVLVDTPVSEAVIAINQQWRSGASSGTRSFCLNARCTDTCTQTNEDERLP